MMATSVDYDRHALDIENFSFIPVLSFDLLASTNLFGILDIMSSELFDTDRGRHGCNATKPKITILGSILIKVGPTINRAQNCKS